MTCCSSDQPIRAQHCQWQPIRSRDSVDLSKFDVFEVLFESSLCNIPLMLRCVFSVLLISAVSWWGVPWDCIVQSHHYHITITFSAQKSTICVYILFYRQHLLSKQVQAMSYTCLQRKWIFFHFVLFLWLSEGLHMMISNHQPPSLDPTHPHPGHNISCCLQTTNHSQPSPALSSGEYEQGCTHYNIINIVTWTSHYNRLHFIPTQPTIFTFCRETQLFVCILHTKYFT